MADEGPSTSREVRLVSYPEGTVSLDCFEVAETAVPALGDVVELRYDRILPAVLAGELDAGLIIHESRFTYAELGDTVDDGHDLDAAPSGVGQQRRPLEAA